MTFLDFKKELLKYYYESYTLLKTGSHFNFFLDSKIGTKDKSWTESSIENFTLNCIVPDVNIKISEYNVSNAITFTYENDFNISFYFSTPEMDSCNVKTYNLNENITSISLESIENNVCDSASYELENKGILSDFIFDNIPFKKYDTINLQNYLVAKFNIYSNLEIKLSGEVYIDYYNQKGSTLYDISYDVNGRLRSVYEFISGI